MIYRMLLTAKWMTQFPHRTLITCQSLPGSCVWWQVNIKHWSTAADITEMFIWLHFTFSAGVFFSYSFHHGRKQKGSTWCKSSSPALFFISFFLMCWALCFYLRWLNVWMFSCTIYLFLTNLSWKIIMMRTNVFQTIYMPWYLGKQSSMKIV